MKKNNFTYYLSLGIIFALFNLIAFVIPTDKTLTFWTAYAFTVLAFLLQIIVWKISFNKNDTSKSKFLGIPIINVTIIYLIIQLFVFAIFMALPMLSVRLSIIVCSIILALFALCAISTQASVDEINHLDEKAKVKRAFIQFLQADIEMLAEAETDAEIKAELKRLAEKVRFSDPMSHEMLGELESRIAAKVEEMKMAENKKTLIGEIDSLLTERNKKCKILK